MSQHAPNRQSSRTPELSTRGVKDIDSLGPEYQQRITPMGQSYITLKPLQTFIRHSGMTVLNLKSKAQSLGVIQRWTAKGFVGFTEFSPLSSSTGSTAQIESVGALEQPHLANNLPIQRQSFSGDHPKTLAEVVQPALGEAETLAEVVQPALEEANDPPPPSLSRTALYPTVISVSTRSHDSSHSGFPELSLAETESAIAPTPTSS